MKEDTCFFRERHPELHGLQKERFKKKEKEVNSMSAKRNDVLSKAFHKRFTIGSKKGSPHTFNRFFNLEDPAE